MVVVVVMVGDGGGGGGSSVQILAYVYKSLDQSLVS